MLLVGKSTISMAMFNSYFDITRGYPSTRRFVQAPRLIFDASNFDTDHQPGWDGSHILFVSDGNIKDESNRVFHKGSTKFQLKVKRMV